MLYTSMLIITKKLKFIYKNKIKFQNELKRKNSKRNMAAMKTKQEIEDFENNLKKLLLTPSTDEKISK